MHKILVTGALDPIGLNLLRAHPDVELDYTPDLPYDQILERIGGYDCIVSRSETDVDRKMIDAGTHLKVIARAAVGVGNIDIEYATQKGILVLNTPAKNTNSAAELTLGTLLALLRKVVRAHQKMEGGGWDRHTFTGRELLGKSLGIVGLGNVGHRVAKFALGFDMKVYAYDPYISDDTFKKYGVIKCERLDDMLPRVDVLTVHVPKNKETSGMIGARELALLPRGSWVLNLARGGIVDEGALADALASGQVGGAGIDTWQVEPVKEHPLKKFPNVVMTPHIGASTTEAQRRIAETVAEQTLKALSGEVVDTPVNMPFLQAELPAELKRYAVLAERMGSFTGQYIDFNPSTIQFTYRGQLASNHSALVKLAFLKGFLRRTVDEDMYVSFVNVEDLVRKKGISLGEGEDPTWRAYNSSFHVTVQSDAGKFSIGGTVFDGSHDRFIDLDGFCFEVEPRGHLLVLRNQDVPGMIGRIGTALGNHHVNIDSFELSRQERGGVAMAMIRTDDRVGEDVHQLLAAIPGILSVRVIHI